MLAREKPSDAEANTAMTWAPAALAHDIAHLAFDRLQHAGERRAQRLLHLHHFKRQNRRALFKGGAHFGQQRHDGARQWRHDPLFANLLLIVATEWIDPMEIKAA